MSLIDYLKNDILYLSNRYNSTSIPNNILYAIIKEKEYALSMLLLKSNETITFEEWYQHEIGISVEKACALGSWDIDLLKKCWDTAKTIGNV